MRRMHMRKLDRTIDAARKAMAVGSLDTDHHRDAADWDAMRRIVTVYMPLMAVAPVLAGLIIYWQG